ncbi:MAG: hypothetical protein FWB97_10045 [Oscillospiraceae bacterium]|nr:hypothetical protein [Oscillospiraceae bacterium]
MALSDISLFQWKRKAEMEREQVEYEKWAFPYGEKQRENLQALLFAVFPKRDVPSTLIPFLTCRELYETALKHTGRASDEIIDMLINKQRKYKSIIKKKDMTTLIALVLADAAVDERAEYPSAEVIHHRAEELEKLRRE